MRIRRIGTSVLSAILLALVMMTVSVTAGATGERWYMLNNCQFDNPTQGDYVINAYGLVNLDASSLVTVVCAQPHLVGNNGYDQSYAYVLARSDAYDFIVDLCRSDGGQGPAICDEVIFPRFRGHPNWRDNAPGVIHGQAKEAA